MSQQDDEKTRIVRRSSSGAAVPPPPPSAGAYDPEQTQYVHAPHSHHGSGPDATRIVQHGSGHGQEAPPPPPVAEGQTVLVRPSSSRKAPGAAAEPDFLPDGPVVGWLVVVKGPGRGRSIQLGYGMNSIGREADNRVPLPFGDELISRRKHAVLTYDPRGRKFYLQHGDSVNLTYIGDTPVLAPMVLEGGETIRLGSATELRFVALCGTDFDWEEAGE